MPWWTSEWTRWIGWTLLYALAVWGASAVQSLLEPGTVRQESRNVASWARFLIPLALAFLIGVQLRSWWWVGGPPAVTILMTLTYPTFAYLTSPRPSRRKAKAGLTIAVTLAMIDAGVVLFAAAAGVICGKTLLN